MEKALDPSILAAFALGPKTGIPTENWSDQASSGVERNGTFAEVGLNAIDEGLLGTWQNERNLDGCVSRI